MIDPNDRNTLPLLPVLPKKRGRKPKDNIPNAAQRKANQRARDGWITANAAAKKDFSLVTTTGLIEQLAKAVAAKNPDMVKMLSKELVKRATQKTTKKIGAFYEK